MVFSNKILVWGLIVFGVGVGWSYLNDYKVWRDEETKNYGQGVGGKRQAEPYKLDTVYQNDVVGVRLRFFGEWQVEENSKFKLSNLQTRLVDVIKYGQREEVVRFGDEIKVSVELRKMSLPDITDAEVAKIFNERKGPPDRKTVAEKEKWVLNRDREFIVTEKINSTVLSWAYNAWYYRRALIAQGDKLVVLDLATSNQDEADKLERTFEQMVRSLVFI